MKHYKTLSLAAGAIVFMTACTTTGNVERDAAIGAAGGAVVGAIIGNNTGSGDAETAAKVGAVVGAAGGVYSGMQKDKMDGEGTRSRQNQTAQGQPLVFEPATGRYYYTDPATGRTYYQNGQLRG